MIDNDFILILGIVIAVLTVPGILSSMLDRSPPRAAAFAAVVGGAMILYAIYNEPGGYAVEDIPDIFTRVVANILN